MVQSWSFFWGFEQFRILGILNWTFVCTLKGIWVCSDTGSNSFTPTFVNIEITVFEATEPIRARCFTQSSISVNFLELSMRFSRHFFEWKKKINTSRKWRLFDTKWGIFTQPKVYNAKNKITNVSKRFVYHMSELGSWRFGCVKIDQHYCWSHPFTNSGNLVAHLMDTYIMYIYKCRV